MVKIDPAVSEYFSNLARKRKDNNRGFNSPEVVRKAIETRQRNAKNKTESQHTQKEG